MRLLRLVLLPFLFFGSNLARADFQPALLLQNNSYWGDGKAEFNIYGGEIARYGIPRPADVLHILVREPFDPKQLVKPDNWQQPGIVQVLKLNQILHVPTGLYVYQQMHSSFWQVDDGHLLKFSLTSNDSCGNTFKEGKRTEAGDFDYFYHTYWDGMADGQEKIAPPANSYFYDELPLLVRTIDFSKPGEFEIQLAGSMINSKKDNFSFKPAKVSYTAKDRSLEVKVEHAGGVDLFTLDRDEPHLLRDWRAADGSHLKLKRTLKVAYWNYNKPGDLERALNDPMLRPPD